MSEYQVYKLAKICQQIRNRRINRSDQGQDGAHIDKAWHIEDPAHTTSRYPHMDPNAMYGACLSWFLRSTRSPTFHTDVCNFVFQVPQIVTGTYFAAYFSTDACLIRQRNMPRYEYSNAQLQDAVVCIIAEPKCVISLSRVVNSHSKPKLQ